MFSDLLHFWERTLKRALLSGSFSWKIIIYYFHSDTDRFCGLEWVKLICPVISTVQALKWWQLLKLTLKKAQVWGFTTWDHSVHWHLRIWSTRNTFFGTLQVTSESSEVKQYKPLRDQVLVCARCGSMATRPSTPQHFLTLAFSVFYIEHIKKVVW